MKTNVEKKKSDSLRRDIIQMIMTANGGHTGGSLSVLDILAVLYYEILNINPQNLTAPERDRLILSKGHSAEAYFAVLADRGFFPKELLSTYGQPNSPLYGHPTMSNPGVEAATGALGHGLSIGVGMALGAKRCNQSFHTFVVMGDGELAEGSVWEAAMAGSHFKLDNLTGIIDYNKLQISGSVDNVMSTGSLRHRWEAFGWQVLEVDGHNFKELKEVFNYNNVGGTTSGSRIAGVPRLIIAHTTKGKGISYMENQAGWHHRVPNPDEFKQAMSELGFDKVGR